MDARGTARRAATATTMFFLAFALLAGPAAAVDLYVTNSANADPLMAVVSGASTTVADSSDGLSAPRQIAVRADGKVLIADALADVRV